MASATETEVKKSSPWGEKSNSPPIVYKLEEVMSEQLVDELSNDFDSGLQFWDELHVNGEQNDTLSNDEVVARLLQQEFDEEYNTELLLQQNHQNGTSKVTVSYEKFLQPSLNMDDSIEDFDFVVDKSHGFESTPKGSAVKFKKSGFSGKGKNIITKHDPQTCNKSNVKKAMENFGPSVETGDGDSFDMMLPNKVYNNLKTHSHTEAKRSQKFHEKKENSTAEKAVDYRTRIMMFKLVNNGTLDSITGSISTGKESIVFHACGSDNQEFAIKVFKTTLSDFKNRAEYLNTDYRFNKSKFSKQNPRKLIPMWAEKEMLNLNRIARHDIPCPSVLTLKKHILVMSFIGKNQIPAPKLKDLPEKVSYVQLEIFYDQCIQIIIDLYRKAGLVHGDLSEYNLLWFDDKVWVIDVSQSVRLDHPLANQFLLRDCQNIVQFFEKHGLQNDMNYQELFNKVTNMDITLQNSDEEFLNSIKQ